MSRQERKLGSRRNHMGFVLNKQVVCASSSLGIVALDYANGTEGMPFNVVPSRRPRRHTEQLLEVPKKFKFRSG